MYHTINYEENANKNLHKCSLLSALAYHLGELEGQLPPNHFFFFFFFLGGGLFNQPVLLR